MHLITSLIGLTLICSMFVSTHLTAYYIGKMRATREFNAFLARFSQR